MSARDGRGIALRALSVAGIALFVGVLPACDRAEPIDKQFATDIKRQKEKRMGPIDEAFVSVWTSASGETVRATCMIYGSKERPNSVVAYPHGDGFASIELGDIGDPEWVKYCSQPVSKSVKPR